MANAPRPKDMTPTHDDENNKKIINYCLSHKKSQALKAFLTSSLWNETGITENLLKAKKHFLTLLTPPSQTAASSSSSAPHTAYWPVLLKNRETAFDWITFFIELIQKPQLSKISSSTSEADLEENDAPCTIKNIQASASRCMQNFINALCTQPKFNLKKNLIALKKLYNLLATINNRKVFLEGSTFESMEEADGASQASAPETYLDLLQTAANFFRSFIEANPKNTINRHIFFSWRVNEKSAQQRLENVEIILHLFPNDQTIRDNFKNYVIAHPKRMTNYSWERIKQVLALFPDDDEVKNAYAQFVMDNPKDISHYDITIIEEIYEYHWGEPFTTRIKAKYAQFTNTHCEKISNYDIAKIFVVLDTFKTDAHFGNIQQTYSTFCQDNIEAIAKCDLNNIKKILDLFPTDQNIKNACATFLTVYLPTHPTLKYFLETLPYFQPKNQYPRLYAIYRKVISENLDSIIRGNIENIRKLFELFNGESEEDKQFLIAIATDIKNKIENPTSLINRLKSNDLFWLFTHYPAIFLPQSGLSFHDDGSQEDIIFMLSLIEGFLAYTRGKITHTTLRVFHDLHLQSAPREFCLNKLISILIEQYNDQHAPFTNTNQLLELFFTYFKRQKREIVDANPHGRLLRFIGLNPHNPSESSRDTKPPINILVDCYKAFQRYRSLPPIEIDRTIIDGMLKEVFSSENTSLVATTGEQFKREVNDFFGSFVTRHAESLVNNNPERFVTFCYFFVETGLLEDIPSSLDYLFDNKDFMQQLADFDLIPSRLNPNGAASPITKHLEMLESLGEELENPEALPPAVSSQSPNAASCSHHPISTPSTPILETPQTQIIAIGETKACQFLERVHTKLKQQKNHVYAQKIEDSITRIYNSSFTDGTMITVSPGDTPLRQRILFTTPDSRTRPCLARDQPPTCLVPDRPPIRRTTRRQLNMQEQTRSTLFRLNIPNNKVCEVITEVPCMLKRTLSGTKLHTQVEEAPLSTRIQTISAPSPDSPRYTSPQ